MPLGPVSLAVLAEHTGATLAGDPATLIHRVGTLREARRGDIAFLANPRYRRDLSNSAASAVIVAPDAAGLVTGDKLVHPNPYACFARIAQLLDPHPAPAPGVHPAAYVAPTARLGHGVSVGAHAVIGDDAVVGDGSVVHPHATILARVRIGARAIVHAQAVIGSDGFGFALDAGHWIKIPQTGTVVVGDDVEIGAGTTIDRGAIEDTVIGDGVKLDNQIQVGHNVRIGAHTAMAGCVGIAGSAVIGRHCTVGGGAVILGHLVIADHVNISAGAMVTKSISAPGTYGGAYPLAPQREWLRSAAHVRALDDMAERLAALERRLRELERRE
ncbi:MAG: UDP-3-O-(3-hydroxymyristoyl)glucosamine N-acyltransferase [Burkholderiales bacterium]|nr:UDP-3-O-(3-hydroxymyristoyl)glucosamine N-acyltransferase [Burkholderiales bacterium]